MKQNTAKASRNLMRPENDNLQRLIALTREMITLSDQGDQDRADVSCGIIYGVLRDTAFRLRKMCEAELEKHDRQGRWP